MRKANVKYKVKSSDPVSKKRRLRMIIILLLVLLIVGAGSITSWSIHLNNLRTEMENYFSDAVSNIERGVYTLALIDAEEARVLAERLRDSEAAEEIENHIRYVETVIWGNELFDAGMYERAFDAYLMASDYVLDISTLSSGYIDEALIKTEGYIDFYALIDRAEVLAERLRQSFEEVSLAESAISLYEEARTIATTLSFAEGMDLAAAGIAEMQERIAVAKRYEAMLFLIQGDQNSLDEQYIEAIEQYNAAMEIYRELNDEQSIASTTERIGFAERRLEEKERREAQAAQEAQEAQEAQDKQTVQDTQSDPAPAQNETESNYDHNKSINFNLSTLIDYQNRRPANQIRMGSTDGRNEGWYNGCGWIATYNALILLGNPQHPADIVNHFETSGGTVFGGVFGTYPKAILEYLLGYAKSGVSSFNLPQITTNIDNEIKNARVGILAYAHTSAAHYVTIEYREDIGKFVVYNDSFARARSASLGLENETRAGAAIDSVIAWINETPEILFTFSLITAK